MTDVAVNYSVRDRTEMRLAFYYAWFPRNWTQHGIPPYANFTPSLNYYDSAKLDIIKKPIAAMEYSKIDERSLRISP